MTTQEIQELNQQIGEEPKSLEKSQDDKFIIMLLKEKWEEIEALLKKRMNFRLINITMSSFVMLFGIVLFYIFWKQLASNLFRIVTSSVLASGGVLALLKILIENLKSKKDTVMSVVETAKMVASDQVFMPAIIILGWIWFNNTLLTFFERKIEWMLNFTIEPPESYINKIFYVLGFVILKPIFELITVPLTLYYCLAKRLYLIDVKMIHKNAHEKFGKNCDKKCCKGCDIISYDRKDKVILDEYDIVTFFGDDEKRRKYKARIFGNKEERNGNYKPIDLINNIIGEFQNRLVKSILNMGNHDDEFQEDPEKQSKEEKGIESHADKKDLARTLKLHDPLNAIEKLVVYSAILVLRMETEYQLIIESIEITEKQKDELRRLLSG
ncbi:16062_t:CDS:2, partial [Gigaspora margarita]